MAGRLSALAGSFAPSLIGEISLLAERCGAINLSEGFPNYPAPSFLKDAAVAAITGDINQYSYRQELLEAIAGKYSARLSIHVDTTEVAITCGQSAALACALLAVLNPGDEVLILDPSYETYKACVSVAGGIPKYVQLQPPDWKITRPSLEVAISSKTSAIIINSPNNPTGRVITEAELSLVAEICTEHDLIAITDEVYEYLVFEGARHVSLISLPGMRERTILTSSISKTFCVTGWRIGWAIAPKEIATAIAKLHCKLNDSPPAPFQKAAVLALASPTEYYVRLVEEYEEKRAMLCAAIESGGLSIPSPPQGGMFVFAEIPPSFEGSDFDFAKDLIKKARVAVVPGSNFFHADDAETMERDKQERGGREVESKRNRYVRVAFCKAEQTLKEAAAAFRQFGEEYHEDK